MAESAFNKKFRTQMEVRGMKIYRVETHSSCPGMSDNHYVLGSLGRSGWIEMKETAPSEIPTKINFQPKQVPWLLDYTNHGGVAFVIIHVPRLKTVFALHGRDAQKAAQDFDSCPAQSFSLESDTVWTNLFNWIRLRTP
jgi:penicillin-binding protein-related factor A (putative recombinase)